MTLNPRSTLSSGPFSALDLLSSAVVLVDDRLVIRYLNAGAENLFAVSQRRLLGMPLSTLLGEPPGLAAALDNALRQNWSYTGQDLKIARQNGDPLHLDCTVSPADAAGVRLLLEFRPIDAQLRVAREEQLLQQQQANRELIRNLAHEIKNPLGGIRGSAQLLERELADPQLREYTEVIIAEADRLQDLMNRLLTSHCMMRPGQLNIHDVLERVRRLILAEFPDLEIRRDYDTSLPEFTADREQLIQAILNIVRNAAQAMQGQGEIRLRTRAARQVTLAKRRFKLALELQVIDNGPGIPEEIRDKIFYPLVSGREGGSGLGLSLAQSFVEQHQGMIEVDSRPGHTCFSILLPIVDRA
ncbi:MAG: nitrogen regulation protein NR(II) [Aromatoleum sp.]|jgi:two-component system nitrogen regulation sensor histidine kinase GlnL|uniref:nitrogen regulation protein NR(II) n=1 Tax=Aromatoleum sp. TaxID=2307007 RepID=UPI0028956FD8|nr:nitrogen regulation protein NR(II) [Aromatoleum sp.]MDT3670909.1 nitrogen regulation protein NR(II) [Aromatoleum sp.]